MPTHADLAPCQRHIFGRLFEKVEKCASEEQIWAQRLENMDIKQPIADFRSSVRR